MVFRGGGGEQVVCAVYSEKTLLTKQAVWWGCGSQEQARQLPINSNQLIMTIHENMQLIFASGKNEENAFQVKTPK